MRFVKITWGDQLYHSAVALRSAVLRHPLGMEFTQSELDLESDQHHFVAIDQQNQVLGCVSILPLQPDIAKIRQMAVAENSRGQGIGRALIAEVESWLTANQFRQIRLHARQTAIGFYERLGYTASGPVFIEVRIPHRSMEKTLSPSVNGYQFDPE